MNKYFIIKLESHNSPILIFSNKDTKEEVINDFIGQLIAKDLEIEPEDIPVEWDEDWIEQFELYCDVILSPIYDCQTFQEAFQPKW